MAVTCAASYGLAVASANIPVPAGERILVLEDDHTSQALTWQAKAQSAGAVLDKVPRPADGDWTHAILSHLRLGSSRRIALASLCDTFWIDGSRIDLPVVCAALHALEANIVLDLTQSAGILDIDLKALHVDFAVFPLYKWLLGPYSLALLYVSPQWQNGIPLEQNSFNRDLSGNYSAGAARFDMGERDTFVGVPTALSALELSARWPRDGLRRHLLSLTRHMQTKLSDGVAAACRSRNVFFTQRHGYVRISPHVFNSLADADRCANELINAAAATR
jgi:selenocysteine lyase/cysteine desulfurase